ncbi:MAG: HAMP domain-containing histidine kinase [Burkholderiales bacterium]|nr:HAMP domain-containing histidine kinase [Anaerolineae bacterium]
MRWTLRTRLLISYLLLLAMVLGVILLSLLYFLNTRPSPPEPIYQHLSAVVQQGDFRNILTESATIFPRSRRDEFFIEALTEFALLHNVRVLIANPSRQSIEFDSAGVWPSAGEFVTEATTYNAPRLQSVFAVRPEVMFGGFSDPSETNGGDWLFIGLSFPATANDPNDDQSGGIGGPAPTTDANDNNVANRQNAIYFAEPRLSQSLQLALSQFGDALALPICQSALVGLIVALVLAALISRTIARPLQNVASATTAIAEGHYDQRVPVSGPPEVRAVAEAFNHMSAQVHDTQQAQQDFLANVSHDLKTPLTSIRGYSQAIMDGAAKDPTHAAKIIHDEAERLNRMVVELTDLARLQAGRLSMQAAEVDMAQLASAIAQRLSIMAKEKGVSLHVDTKPTPTIAGDGDRLAQVVDNLIGNAIKYTPTGGEVSVETYSTRNGGIEFLVRDSGIGIPPQDLPRVFERFYQVDKTRGPQRGTGLGLAIVAEIVQAHGGRITASSAGHGHGSTFTVWLPSPHMSTVVRRFR